MTVLSALQNRCFLRCAAPRHGLIIFQEITLFMTQKVLRGFG